MPDDDNVHANVANEQVRQAKENGTILDSRPNYSMIRLVVDGEKLTADNPIDYLVMLLLEGKRYDGNWDGDEQQSHSGQLRSGVRKQDGSPTSATTRPGNW